MRYTYWLSRLIGTGKIMQRMFRTTFQICRPRSPNSDSSDAENRLDLGFRYASDPRLTGRVPD